MFLAVDDPSFTFFVGLTLLRRMRDKLMLTRADKIPELITQVRATPRERLHACPWLSSYERVSLLDAGHHGGRGGPHMCWRTARPEPHAALLPS
jgi:hypothetical protein